MTYALPTNVTSMVEYIAWANGVANDLPIKLFLLSIWIISTTWLLSMGKESEALLISTTIVLILAMLFMALGLVAGSTIMMIVILMGVLGALTWMVNR